MGERRWTAEQTAAITTRDRTLLVSAAAGSGKTATLTERIIRTLCDTESPTSINELLVVTFTNAAASEMRERITASLKDACAKAPDNKHLQRQIMLLPSAKIRTIDSFCNDLLRLNVDRVGISPSYRILDEAEGQLLAFSILESMINAVYDGALAEVATAEEFEALADCLTGSKQMNQLSEVIYALYEKTACEENQFATLEAYRDAYEPSAYEELDRSPFVEYYLDKMHGMCDYYVKYIDMLAGELASGSDEERKYVDAFLSDKAVFAELLTKKSYRKMRDAITLEWRKIPPKKSGTELTDLQISARKARDAYKDVLKSMKLKAFSYTDEALAYCFSGLYTRLGTLVRFLRRFDELFMSEKRRRAAFSYHDIERFTYECLWQNGERTDVARALSNEYKCVYIDEYQDVNAIQDKIFEAVSKEDNRFMVGDIKQSIYAFRGAESEIFAAMKKSFPKLDPASPDKAASIFMSENFRCDEGIINFVNGIFDKIFGVIGEGIGYESADRLKYGKGAIVESPNPLRAPEVIVVTDPGTEDESRGMAEPMVIAREIKRLIDTEKLNSGEPIRPKDVAILMRQTKSRAADYAAALASVGVPARIGGEKDFFLNREILLALCLLNSIDNPQRDVYLAGLMRSPLYDFTADELWLISSPRRGSLYSSLVCYLDDHPDFIKGARFISGLKKYRAIAESSSVSSLIYRLYRETGLLALAAKNGVKDNLNLLFDYAKDFERRGSKGLYGFISFINELISKKAQFDTKRESADTDEVNIMTTHSSKGLEYAVVFLAEGAKGFHRRDPRDASNINYTRGFGLSFPLRTHGGLGKVDGISDLAIQDFAKDKAFDEEMRVLYVALTRARERLYAVGKSKDPEEYIAKMREYGEVLTPYSVRQMKSALDVICATRPDAVFKTEELGESDADISEQELIADEPSASIPDSGITKEELLSRFAYTYPNAHLTKLPEKMSVSRLHPTVLDGTDGTAFDLEDMMRTDAGPSDTDEKRTYPDFFTGKPSDESAKRGIATHLFMQFCNLELVKAVGAECELERLYNEGFISSADKARVRLGEIRLFEKSELFSAMLGAKRIYRELRFNVRLPASAFTAENEMREALSERKILVQGVIDCIIEDENGALRLIDYKTDRLTKEELADGELAAKVLVGKHKTQLSYYAMAVESIFGRRPSSVEIYSLPLGRCIDID